MTDVARRLPVRWFVSLQCAGIVLTTILACAESQTGPDRGGQAPEAEVLARSEMEYTEGGGLAGRIHRARLIAIGGRVSVEYLPGESRDAQVLRGVLDANRYTALWREAERIDVWKMKSAPKSRGADVIESELRVRLDAASHVVRWQLEASLPAGVAGAAELGRRMLAMAREVTMEQ